MSSKRRADDKSSGVHKKFKGPKVFDEIELLNPTYRLTNVGGVIEDLIEILERDRINHVSLCLRSHHMHGNFNLPEAIGFSTPMEAIGAMGGLLYLCRDDSLPDNHFMDKFRAWNEIYSTETVKNNDIYKFTRDRKECCICLAEYELGEDITELQCGHVFHHECTAEWKSKSINGPSGDRLERSSADPSLHIYCPLCDEICPRR